MFHENSMELIKPENIILIMITNIGARFTNQNFYVKKGNDGPGFYREYFREQDQQQLSTRKYQDTSTGTQTFYQKLQFITNQRKNYGHPTQDVINYNKLSS